MRALVISAIVMFAVIMGMSAMAPAFADRGPPADPPAGELPEITCDELEKALAELEDVSDEVKDIIRKLADCPTD